MSIKFTLGYAKLQEIKCQIFLSFNYYLKCSRIDFVNNVKNIVSFLLEAFLPTCVLILLLLSNWTIHQTY